MESHDDKIVRIEAEDKRRFIAAVNEAIRGNAKSAPPETESLSVEGMGFKGRITSQHLVYVVLGILLSLAIAYMIRDHDVRSAASVQVIIESQREIVKTVSEGNYILMQDDAWRRDNADRIAMPESLRAKIDGPRR